MDDDEERDLANEAYSRVADFIVKEYSNLPAEARARFLWVCLKDLRQTLRLHLENVEHAEPV